MNPNELKEMRASIDRELREGILPFWSTAAVDPAGGFYGRVKEGNIPETDAPKGAVLNARLLWSFSRAYGFYKDPALLELADSAFSYLTEYFVDRENGGLFWMLDSSGAVLNSRKQVYGQAFGIYAFCEYYKVSGKPEARDQALALFDCLENHVRDREFGGYFEAFTREWGEMEDVRLSEVDQNDRKSNNTHLHIMEAYTSLHRMEESPRTAEALDHVTRMMMEKIYNPEKVSCTLFFTEEWESRSGVVSYGHDIEAAWLFQEALDALNNSELTEVFQKEILRISARALESSMDGELGRGGMNNEKLPDGRVDRDKIWWVQNEAMVGFLNAYEHSGKEDYIRAAANIWQFSLDHLIYPDGGWRLSASGDGVTASSSVYKADEWTCPYHNTRACIEAMERLDKITGNLKENN
ncbi:MAG: AGE family epimerase/isomerase [Spirochaetales bacterium]|nr:AGE family epimerase/isomerase [Spirochaetales bacterium]